MPIDVSLIIVNWNGRALLRDLLLSIDRHGGAGVESIVVDNASIDGSPDMVAEEFPHVRLIRNDRNAGFAVANNQGAAVASGRELLFLNNDTALRPGSLQTLLRFFEDHPDAVAAGPQLIGTDGKPQSSARNLLSFGAVMYRISFLRITHLFDREYQRYRNRTFDPNGTIAVGQLAGAALLVRREAFERVGRWDEGFEFGGEDIDLCKRLAAIGSIWYVATAQVEHVGRLSTRSNRPYAYRTYECGYARYLAKHAGRGRAVMYKLLVTIDMPLRVGRLAFQFAAARVAGKLDKAERIGEFLSAASEFMRTGLRAFWRA